MTINFGLSGLFIKRTPNELIKGYEDPLTIRLYNTPVYIIGGDKAVRSTNVSIDAMLTYPDNNPVAFFTGEDDF